MSDKDFDKFWQMIGGDKRDPRDVIRAIQNTSQVVLTTIDAGRQQINSHPSIKNFEPTWGFNPGIQVPRVEELLIEMGREDLIPTFRDVTSRTEIGKINAVTGAQNSSLEQTPVTVKSKEEYDALPSGARYIDPTGVERTKN